jgi:O-antigen/teichoic acid export membrane protein
MLKNNIIANYLGQGWNTIIGFVFIPLYIKYIGIEAYGIIGIFGILQAWLSLLDLGMTPTLGREMARFTGGARSKISIRDLLRSIEIIAYGIAFLIAIIVYLGSKWIAVFWLNVETIQPTVIANALTIIGIVISLRFLENLYHSALVGLQKQVLYNKINSTVVTIRSVGVIGILHWISPTIEAFFYWQFACSVVSLGALTFFTYVNLAGNERSGRFSKKEVFGIRRFAGGIMGISLVTLILTQLDKIILSKTLSLSELGVYSLAAIFAGAMQTFIGPISSAYAPKFSELVARNKNRLIALNFHRASQLVSIILGSVSSVIILYPDVILSLWLSDETLVESTWLLLRLMIISQLIVGLWVIPFQLQLAYGWTRLSFYVNLISIIFVAPTMLIVIPEYGAKGAVYTYIILHTGFITIGAHFAFKRVLQNEKFIWYVKDLMFPIFSAFVAVAFLKIIFGNPETTITKLIILTIATLTSLLASTLAACEYRKVLQSAGYTFLLKIIKRG